MRSYTTARANLIDAEIVDGRRPVWGLSPISLQDERRHLMDVEEIVVVDNAPTPKAPETADDSVPAPQVGGRVLAYGAKYML